MVEIEFVELTSFFGRSEEKYKFRSISFPSIQKNRPAGNNSGIMRYFECREGFNLNGNYKCLN